MIGGKKGYELIGRERERKEIETPADGFFLAF